MLFYIIVDKHSNIFPPTRGDPQTRSPASSRHLHLRRGQTPQYIPDHLRPRLGVGQFALNAQFVVARQQWRRVKFNRLHDRSNKRVACGDERWPEPKLGLRGPCRSHEKESASFLFCEVRWLRWPERFAGCCKSAAWLIQIQLNSQRPSLAAGFLKKRPGRGARSGPHGESDRSPQQSAGSSAGLL